MNEHSDAAKAAYPDEYYDARLGLGPQLNPWTAAYRSGFDRGAATAYAVTREALLTAFMVATPLRVDAERGVRYLLGSGIIRDVNEVKAQQREVDAATVERLGTRRIERDGSMGPGIYSDPARYPEVAAEIRKGN